MAHATRWWVAAAAGVVVVGSLVWWAAARDGSSPESAPQSAPATQTSLASASSSPATATPSPRSTTPTPPSPSRTTAAPSTPAPSGGVTATDTPVATAPAGSGVADVDVALTSWGYDASKGLTASGVVSGVVENSGTCTLQASRGQTVRRATGRGHASASTTACAAGLRIPAGDLAPGDWRVRVTYLSARARGTSDIETVHVGG